MTLAPLVLASASQTRIDMLKNAGLEFTQQPASADEDSVKVSLVAEGAPPREIADALADLKAHAVSQMRPEALVIGADQILVKDGQIFSKATDRKSARATLLSLSGGEHKLISAAVVYQNGRAVWHTLDEAKLIVRPLSEKFVEGYLDALGDDAFWSVGCYQLEGLGSQLFTKIDGDFFTVLGLPLLPLLDFFRLRGYMPL